MNRSLIVLPLAVVALAGCGSSNAKKSASSSSGSGTTSASATGGGLIETASDFKFSQSNLTAKAGKVKITLKNAGQAPHEFILLKTNAAPDSLKQTNGRVSEKASVGEIGEQQPGASGSHTFDLKPGKYVFVCNVPGHYGDGMRGQLTVT